MTIAEMSYIIVLDNNNNNNRNVIGFCSFLLNTEQEILDKHSIYVIYMKFISTRSFKI